MQVCRLPNHRLSGALNIALFSRGSKHTLYSFSTIAFLTFLYPRPKSALAVSYLSFFDALTLTLVAARR